MDLVKNVLFCLLRLVVLVGLFICTFGYSYSYMFLHLYGGPILSEGERVVSLNNPLNKLSFILFSNYLHRYDYNMTSTC